MQTEGMGFSEPKIQEVLGNRDFLTFQPHEGGVLITTDQIIDAFRLSRGSFGKMWVALEWMRANGNVDWVGSFINIVEKGGLASFSINDRTQIINAYQLQPEHSPLYINDPLLIAERFDSNIRSLVIGYSDSIYELASAHVAIKGLGGMDGLKELSREDLMRSLKDQINTDKNLDDVLKLSMSISDVLFLHK